MDQEKIAKIAVPEAPGILPAALQEKWRATYEKTFTQSESDSPNEPGVHPQIALRAANALLAFDKPKSYAEAMAMPDWQIVKREERDGKLIVVTIEARGKSTREKDGTIRVDSKFVFDIPAKKAKD